MSRLFYHPLGSYAANYTPTSSPSAKPHTRTNHGFNKIDYGCGGGLTVYSMTNGVVAQSGTSGDGVSKNIVVVRCTENGYSEMMADLKGGSAENFPIYISYIEMDEIKVSAGDSVSPGTPIGITNSEYSGSNVHIDIGAYARYGSGNILTSGDLNRNNSNLITSDADNQLAIGCRQIDAYGDKGITKEEVLEKYLNSNFTYDGTGIKDKDGNYLGVLSNNHYYPPSSSGGAVLTQTVGTYPQTGDNSCPIEDFYHYMICLQNPIYQAGSGATSDATAQGEESVSEIYQALRSVGYGINSSIAIIGNSYAESSWNSDNYQSKNLADSGKVYVSDFSSAEDFANYLTAAYGLWQFYSDENQKTLYEQAKSLNVPFSSISAQVAVLKQIFPPERFNNVQAGSYTAKDGTITWSARSETNQLNEEEYSDFVNYFCAKYEVTDRILYDNGVNRRLIGARKAIELLGGNPV